MRFSKKAQEKGTRNHSENVIYFHNHGEAWPLMYVRVDARRKHMPCSEFLISCCFEEMTLSETPLLKSELTLSLGIREIFSNFQTTSSSALVKCYKTNEKSTKLHPKDSALRVLFLEITTRIGHRPMAKTKHMLTWVSCFELTMRP